MEPSSSTSEARLKDIRINLQRISKDVVWTVPAKYATGKNANPVSTTVSNKHRVEVTANRVGGSGGSVSMEVEPGENCSLNLNAKTPSPTYNVTLQLHEPGEYKINIHYKHHGTERHNFKAPVTGLSELKRPAGSSQGEVAPTVNVEDTVDTAEGSEDDVLSTGDYEGTVAEGNGQPNLVRPADKQPKKTRGAPAPKRRMVAKKTAAPKKPARKPPGAKPKKPEKATAVPKKPATAIKPRSRSRIR